MFRFSWLAIATVGMFVESGTAQATPFQVSPAQISLSTSAPSTIVTISNAGDSAKHFQLAAFTWQEKPNGELEMTPTRDVFCFPAVVDLGPHESRPVRVGTETGFGSSEKSYSLFVQEMGADDSEVIPAASQSNRGIPVFVRPTRPAAAARIDELSVKRGHVQLKVRNVGTAHFRLRNVRLVGDGQARWEQAVPAWYVLPGHVRAWDYQLPADVCGRLKQISVEFEGDEVAGRSSILVPSEACSDPVE